MIFESKSTNLTEREAGILRDVVHNYILTATPVGSKHISSSSDTHLSAASIRNVMAHLEEMGLLSHPYTSAGRVPTDLGYRYYVNYLMEIEQITNDEKLLFESNLEGSVEPQDLLRETSKILSKISRQLSIVSSPSVSNARLEKLELVPIASSKLLIVISIRSGIVRTIMLEVGVDFRKSTLDAVSRILNKRLSGLTLREIRETFADRTKDMQDEKTGLIRLFVDSVDQLFDDEKGEKLHLSGAQNIIEQPEFIDPKNFRSVIELIENDDFIIHLLEKHHGSDRKSTVTIGAENEDDKAEEYSVVSATYELEGVSGRVGIIGPKRMNYAKIVPLVDHVARVVAKMMAS